MRGDEGTGKRRRRRRRREQLEQSENIFLDPDQKRSFLWFDSITLLSTLI